MVCHSECPLCSSDKIDPWLVCTDHLVSHGQFELYKCHSCGFVFTRKYPEEEQIGRYYDSSGYVAHDDKAPGIVNRIYEVVRKIMLRKKRKLVTEITGLAGGRVLDIGCGTGYFAFAMKEAGWIAEGIEPNLKARDHCKTNFGINVIDPSAINSLPSEQYDCITFWHVLEHLHDPSGYASEVQRLLKPGGVCITALPNSSSYDSDFYGKNWAGFDVPRHLWHFTPETIDLFASKTGFVINGKKRLPFDVFYISVLSEKHKGVVFPLLKGMARGSWFALKACIRPDKNSSLIYIMKRRS